MRIEQYFTDKGMWGVVLFIAGNLLAAFCLRQIIISTMAEPATELTYICCFAGGVANLASVPMMLIGRAYNVTIVHIPKDRIS